MIKALLFYAQDDAKIMEFPDKKAMEAFLAQTQKGYDIENTSKDYYVVRFKDWMLDA